MKAVCARVEGDKGRKWKILYEVIGKRKRKSNSTRSPSASLSEGLSAHMINKFDKNTHMHAHKHFLFVCHPTKSTVHVFCDAPWAVVVYRSLT